METGGSNPDLGMVDGILKFCPPERLLYGSDGPGRAFFPQIWKILESSLSADDRDKVLHRNVMELLELPEPEPVAEVDKTPGSVPGPTDIDHFCFCGRYPYESRPETSPEQLEAGLKQEGIAKAYTADFGAVFASDPLAENRRFLRQCRALTRIRPLAAVDPTTPVCETILNKVAAEAGWYGLWLSPAFHLWRLDDPAHEKFLQHCAAVGKPLFINCGFYEPRFYHRDLRFRAVTDDELKVFLNNHPSVPVVIQGKIPFPGAEEFSRCLWCYTQLTDTGSVEKIRKRSPGLKLVRGSEYPFRHLHETLAAAQYG